MPHEDSKPEARHRRFPLTLTTLLGSCIAIPLHIGMNVGLERAVARGAPPTPEPSTPTASAMSNASLATIPTPPDAMDAESGSRAADPGVGGRVGGMLAGYDSKHARPREGASIPTGATPLDDVGDGTSWGGLKGSGAAASELRAAGTGVGGGGRGESKSFLHAAKAARVVPGGVPGGIGGGVSSGAPGPRRRVDGSASAADMGTASVPHVDRKPDAREGGYDETIVAGRLTAGIIDDRDDAKLLDRLRETIAVHDAHVLRAIPDHASVGPQPGAAMSPRTLEIGLVLDTTGSMGDEIEYLKSEIRSIAAEIGREFPNVTQRFALVAYKDHGDVYVVRSHGFVALDGFVRQLGVEEASGGGDTPEAVDEAMHAAASLPWSGDDAAKLVFLVADAPPHARGYTPYVRAAVTLAGRDVSIYPVASSGVDAVCEYLMRWAARTTGGKYLFLTDHSGIGDAHAAPVVDRYQLMPLRTHMLDVIRHELAAREQVIHAPPSTTPSAETPASPSHDSVGTGETSWLERHGLFATMLFGVFLFGFAGDTAMATVRRRRTTTRE